MTGGHWQSYVVPCLAAFFIHLLLAFFVMGGFAGSPEPKQRVKPQKVISASLVELKKVKPAVKPAVKPRQKIKPKKSAPIAQKKPVSVVKPKKAVTKEKLAAVNPPKKAPLNSAPAVVERQLLDALLDDEDRQLAQDREQDEVARYVAAMSTEIIGRWNRPPSARNHMQVLLSIKLVPNGDVVSVNIKEGSGNAALDRSASLAVQKVGRFDMLQGMPRQLFEKHFRNIEIAFRPEDLRL
ncbi:TonB family protein [Pseudomonadales bacterium]|nr:TonB family protein [Pseudomonadales bacterium]